MGNLRSTPGRELGPGLGSSSAPSFAAPVLVLAAALLGWMAIGFTPAVRAVELELSSYLAVRGGSFEGSKSWLDGGFGRLYPGPTEDGELASSAQLHLAIEATLSRRWHAFLHATVRQEWLEAEDRGLGGRDLGVVEAFVERRAPRRHGGSTRLRLGHFLLPTSRENVEVGWSSPYTLSFSALNTWIGEEVRLTGLSVEITEPIGALDSLRLGASLFGGNDTGGALLAWRGWTMGDRLSVYGETLPLPPLPTLDDGRSFGDQRDDGNRPFGSDLDHRLGWVGWARWSRHDRALLQWTHLENRGDRDLHGRPGRQEYAWDTRFDLVAGELRHGDWTFVGEWMSGSSDMGLPPNDLVAIDFEASYLLVSFSRNSWRASLRRDDFRVEDRDSTPYDLNDDRGQAWTLALFWEVGRDLRLGIEALDLETDHPQALPATDIEGRSLQLEMRWYFGG